MRLVREYGFNSFDSGHAENATYEDTRFFELQTFMGIVGCGTSQGAARLQYRRGKEYGPHGDTHLRVVKQFDQEEFLEKFDVALDRLVSLIGSEASFWRPVLVALVISIVYYWNVEAISMVSGISDGEGWVFNFATPLITGWNILLVLAVESVRESLVWNENLPNHNHLVVRRLVQRANEHVPIETVLCDGKFDSMRVLVLSS